MKKPLLGQRMALLKQAWLRAIYEPKTEVKYKRRVVDLFFELTEDFDQSSIEQILEELGDTNPSDATLRCFIRDMEVFSFSPGERDRKTIISVTVLTHLLLGRAKND